MEAGVGFEPTFPATSAQTKTSTFPWPLLSSKTLQLCLIDCQSIVLVMKLKLQLAGFTRLK
jgi:hypothetical protein